MAPDKVEEFKRLLELSRIIYFLPFEINKKLALNLQISEQFQLIYMDKDHNFIKRKADSTFGQSDTGIKLTIMFVLWSESSKKNHGKLTLYKQSCVKLQEDENDLIQTIPLETNTFIIFNSRAFEYEVSDVLAKTMILTNMVPGPSQPPEKKGCGF